ncbi:MAG TPA: hypothetical protein PLF30_04520 [Candidatus Moranbacteria bacterium]|jgi:MFS family permease|nr:hypothetical protein [Candidatus Moranbacteria bacterium]HOF42472.1 hypothetical protein [Candidatus Moranbacteria bacterium]HPX94790.1 hypothetical protein [Candidatus Moranbacteria bacterium]HQB59995.1 hypothetical protein [Candidatus Moranbacteria bacterium]
MNPVEGWGQAVASSLIDLWSRFINFIPTLIGALLVFLIGLAIAAALGKLTQKLIKALRVDRATDKLNFVEKLKQQGAMTSPSVILGKFVEWFLILVFLMAATEILGLEQVTDFLNSILLYIPNLVVATIILTIAFLLGNFIYSIVRSSTRAAGVINANLLASIIKWAVIVFGLLAALIQLGIATSLVNTIFIGIVASISIATGLAFGLGGREEAALILKRLREHMTQK